LSRLLGHPFLLALHICGSLFYLNSLNVCKYIGVCIGLLFHWFIYFANHNCSLIEFPKIGSLSGWTSGGAAVEVAPCKHACMKPDLGLADPTSHLTQFFTPPLSPQMEGSMNEALAC
jgi:hypothetical protein